MYCRSINKFLACFVVFWGCLLFSQLLKTQHASIIAVASANFWPGLFFTVFVFTVAGLSVKGVKIRMQWKFAYVHKNFLSIANLHPLKVHNHWKFATIENSHPPKIHIHGKFTPIDSLHPWKICIRGKFVSMDSASMENLHLLKVHIHWKLSTSWGKGVMMEWLLPLWIAWVFLLLLLVLKDALTLEELIEISFSTVWYRYLFYFVGAD